MRKFNDIRKVTLLGRSEVGKTTLAHKMVTGNFYDSKTSTIGAAYSTIEQNNIKLGIWDTAGQERYDSLVGIYYRDARIVLMVYDMSNLDSIKRLHFYFDKIKEIRNEFDVLLVGTKLDIIDENKREDLKEKLKKRLQEEFKDFTLENEFNYYFVSSKDNIGIKELLDTIFKLCELSEYPILHESSGFNLTDYIPDPTNYCPC